ncbi:hypothetical protein Tco_1287312 [Tanacetum coccineum]
MPTSLSKTVTRANDKEKLRNGMRCLKTPSKFVKSLTFGALTLWARSRLHEGTNTFSWPLNTCQNGLKRKRSPPMMPESSCRNMESLTVSPPHIIHKQVGKLRSRWSGPFTITQVFPYGIVELSQANGPNFKVNGHRVKHYFGGDVPQLDCPDCEGSRVLGFVYSITRASNPQLHFGNPDILI